jgi:hypothetical protein
MIPIISFAGQDSESPVSGIINDYDLVWQPSVQENEMLDSWQDPHSRDRSTYKISKKKLADEELSIELSYEQDSHPIVHRSKRYNVKYIPAKLDPVEQKRREYATTMAINNHLVGNIVPYGQRLNTVLQAGFMQLPLTIRQLRAPICQPMVIFQREPGTCGSRSVANALSLRDIIANGMSIDSKTIQTMAKKYEVLHTQNGMTSKDQINLAKRFDLHNTYAIAIFPMDPLDNRKSNKYPFTVIESTELPIVDLYHESEILENIVRSIRSQKNIVANFLCHLDGSSARRGHAVVVSIVKREGKTTGMVYMDSNNLPVADRSQVAAYISYLYWQCVA